MLIKDTISAIIVDDHVCARAGYQAILTKRLNFTVLAEAKSGEQAFLLYQKFEPDIVIMDISLPGIGGLEATRRIIARYPGARILISSAKDEIVYVEQALKVKAFGYITKKCSVEELCDAVLSIVDGKRYFEKRFSTGMACLLANKNKSSQNELTVKEYEILRMMALGICTDDIAQKMSLSSKTVANYSSRIKRKLNVKSLACLTRYAIREGIITA